MTNFMKTHLIRLRNGVYVSKSDPNYLEKYLRFYPDDTEKVVEYADSLLEKGENEKAMKWFERAASQGSYRALQILRQHKETEKVNRAKRALKLEQERNRQKWISRAYLFTLLGFALLLFLIALYFFKERFYVHQTEEHIYTTQTFHHDVYPFSEVDPEEQLHLLVVANSLNQYRDLHGFYPSSLDTLVSLYPSNYLSSIPSSIKIEKAGHHTFLVEGGFHYELKGASEERLELHFDKEANALGLVHNGTPLLAFLVASGTAPLPFKESSVLKRVVNPNGGDTILGTRGLVLHDDYALHGTNDGGEIGSRVTKGCLRFENADIEALYPLVSLGTPFKVLPLAKPPLLTEEDIPFSMTGPPMHTESSPETAFHWKH
ncbi:L,D-transpeptidase [Pontibacillus sp. ALD_SL1]|uniref:L,D-transpeptidase n=1 Tax=Pontibacillus sp. ALD_SL1 TaxID=2777185 RepID=UPI001A96F0DA|nr:L,D-transpeptidase [Pontibacillus sp. ALD_SL1]QSS99740.1 L,D-transpeptidase [Pontibacillus sp. ALD_SL1]